MGRERGVSDHREHIREQEEGQRTTSRWTARESVPKGPHPGGVRATSEEERRCSKSARASASSQSDHVRLRPLLALRDLEIDPLTLFKGAVPSIWIAL